MSREGASHTGVSPVVSVVIPTRNRLPLLKEAVESIERQSMSQWEAIVVDDCSTDSTWEWLSELNCTRLRAIRLDHPSERSAARNRGLDETRGEFVLFLDDDDRLMTWALQYLTEWAFRRPGVVVVVGAKREFDNRGHQRRVPHPRFPVERSLWWEEIVLGWCPISGQCLVRSAAVRDAGGWDRKLTVSEDRDLWLRLSRVGGAMLAPRVVLENRAHAGQWRPANVSAVEEELRKRILRGKGMERYIRRPHDGDGNPRRQGFDGTCTGQLVARFGFLLEGNSELSANIELSSDRSNAGKKHGKSGVGCCAGQARGEGG